MPIPEEIRKAERPKNTIVQDHKGNGPYRYSVVKRVGCVAKKGKNYPVNGPTIGHIIDGKYVPIDPPKPQTADVLAYGGYKAADGVGKELLSELEAQFGAKEARQIYLTALLRVFDSGVTDGAIEEKYNSSWAAIDYPGVQLSKNTVSQLLHDIGWHYTSVIAFMRARTAKLSAEAHVAVDGTLKEDNSKVNSLSAYSRKARTKGTRDISVIFAYDVSTREPVCSKVYPGNTLDSSAFASFLTESGLKSGIIVGDKAFQRKAAEKVFDGNKGLHFLCPLKRNDKRIESNGMYRWTGRLKNAARDILFSKAVLPHSWLYGFYDRAKAAKEEKDWFSHSRKDTFDQKEAEKKKGRFGTAVFECDLDLDPEEVYRMYAERWLIEDTFGYYKEVITFDQTNVQSDFSVIGSEFVNFIATTITMRLVKEFDDLGLTKELCFGEIMRRAGVLKKVRLPDGTYMDSTTQGPEQEVLTALGIMAKEPEVPKRKPGRPKKQR